MNSFLRSTPSAFLGLCMLFFASCAVTPDEPAPVKEDPPAVLGNKIFKETFPVANATLSVKDSVVIFFNEKFNKVKTINSVKYRAVIDLTALDNVATTAVWATDSLSVTIYPKDMLLANTAYKISVITHWEYFRTTWAPIVWEGVELKENLKIDFTTKDAEKVIKASNVKYTYPIANQYHFLVEEHLTGFVKLNRAQKSLFTMSGYTYAAVFKKLTGETIETEVTYDSEKDQINFPIPQTLASETIYRFQLVMRPTGSPNATPLLDYHFRTSKYRNFSSKFNAITYTGGTFSVLIVPWRGHYLQQAVASAGEYFDSFESEVKTVPVMLGNPRTQYDVPYACNLVRLEAVMPGTTWYENSLYPWLYAPWTEASFKPTVTRDTSVVGYPPVRAMSLYNLGTGMLTADMVNANSAPAITGGTSKFIMHSLSLIIWQDFMEIQQQVVQKYINVNPSLPREDKMIWNSMPVISSGSYPYKVKYTLPSGQVTTTLYKVMAF